MDDFKKWLDNTIYTVDGLINIKRIEQELHNYYMLLNQIPKVYYHITCGKILDSFTDPKKVCDVADNYYNEIAMESLKDECENCTHKKELLWYKKMYNKLYNMFKS